MCVGTAIMLHRCSHTSLLQVPDSIKLLQTYSFSAGCVLVEQMQFSTCAASELS